MARPSAASVLPRLRLLATGGTIAGAQTDKARRGYKAAAFSTDALIAAVPQLTELAQVEVEQAPRSEARIWMKRRG